MLNLAYNSTSSHSEDISVIFLFRIQLFDVVADSSEVCRIFRILCKRIDICHVGFLKMKDIVDISEQPTVGLTLFFFFWKFL